MKCICRELAKSDQLDEEFMENYSLHHLETVFYDEKTWDKIKECPETGIQFFRHTRKSEHSHINSVEWSLLTK